MEKMDKNTNKNTTEAEYSSVEDPLNMYKPATNDTTLISEIPKMINGQNIIIVSGEGKISVPILGDEVCEEEAFPYLLRKGKLGYTLT